MSVGFHNTEIEESQLRPERPLGLSVLTVINGFYAGLFPVFNAVASLMNDQNAGQEEISLLVLCMTVGIPIAIITTAIGTFKGDDRARFGLLILVTFYFSLAAFQDISMISAGVYADDMVFKALGRVLRSGIWLAVNIWYFLRPSTIAFFRHPLKK